MAASTKPDVGEFQENVPDVKVFHVAEGQNDDVAQVLEGADLFYSEEEEKALLRKVDWILMPIMAVGTGLLMIDKSALGSAATLTINADLGLHGTQYSWAVTVYYFGLLIGTVGFNILLQRYHTGRILAFAFFAWGSVMLGTTGVHNFGQLAALRFLLGLFEAAMPSGFTQSTARFYTQTEQPLRFGLWIIGNYTLPCIFLLIFFGIGHVSPHPLQPWRWIFVLLGLNTICMSFIVLAFFPDKPSNFRWLTARQRVICVERVARSQTGIKNHRFRWYQAKEALTDGKAWLIVLLMACETAGVSMQTNFLGLLIKGFGYTGITALLLQIPGWALGGVISTAMGIATTRVVSLQRCKTLFLAGIACITVSCGAVLYTHPPAKGGSNKALSLVMMTFISLNSVGYVYILSLAGQNFAGTTKKQVVVSMVFLGYCASNAAFPQSFPAREAPAYSTAILTLLCLQCVLLVGCVVLWWIGRRFIPPICAPGVVPPWSVAMHAIYR